MIMVNWSIPIQVLRLKEIHLSVLGVRNFRDYFTVEFLLSQTNLSSQDQIEIFPTLLHTALEGQVSVYFGAQFD